MPTSTQSGATKNATKSAGRGSASAASDRMAIARRTERGNRARRSGLDLPVEALDQGAALRVDLLPVDRANLPEVRVRLGDGQNRSRQRHLAVGRNDIVRRLEHLRLQVGGEMP